MNFVPVGCSTLLPAVGWYRLQNIVHFWYHDGNDAHEVPSNRRNVYYQLYIPVPYCYADYGNKAQTAREVSLRSSFFKNCIRGLPTISI
jgi:hypothetical protein